MATSFKQPQNNAQGTLSVAVTDVGGLELTLTAGHGFSNELQYLTLVDPADSSAYEIVVASAVATNTVTLTARGSQGTTARTWAAGTLVRGYMTAGHLEDLYTAVNAVENKTQKLAATGHFSAAVQLATDSSIGDGTAEALLRCTGAAASSRGFQVETNGSRRVRIHVVDAETGSNAGSNFKIDLYDDSGTYLGNLFTGTRAAGGEALFSRPLRTTGNLTAGGGTVTAGVAATTRGQLAARSGSGGAAPGVVALYSKAGTVYYFWVTDAGVLRVHTSLPTADTDGSAV